jgi:hypothetical protein
LQVIGSKSKILHTRFKNISLLLESDKIFFVDSSEFSLNYT